MLCQRSTSVDFNWSLLFSLCYWSLFLSRFFTHIYNFPLPCLKTAFKNMCLILEGALPSHSQHFPICWQLFGKGAWVNYTVYASCTKTIYLGALFQQKIHCKSFTCAELETQKTAPNYTRPPQSSLSSECRIFCNSIGRAAMLGLCTIWKYFTSNQWYFGASHKL